MKKLRIFDKITNELVGKHNVWEDNYTLENNWKSFDSLTQVAMIVPLWVPDVDPDRNILQPVSFDKTETTEYKHVDRETLPKEVIEEVVIPE